MSPRRADEELSDAELLARLRGQWHVGVAKLQKMRYGSPSYDRELERIEKLVRLMNQVEDRVRRL